MYLSQFLYPHSNFPVLLVLHVMHLLNTTTLELTTHNDDDNIPRYAVLSYRWGTDADEVTYAQYISGQGTDTAGHRKIVNCCALARSRGIEYAWIDTCCIDKRDSAELAEAINSMYAWYANAAECYTYLADIGGANNTTTTNGNSPPPKPLEHSDWFTRGWTLQELLAPRRMIFFNAAWQLIGDKAELSPVIAQRTGISAVYLQSPAEVSTRASVAQKMSWAAGRRTRKKEDRAYSLLGLFGINMPLLYGEGGSKAFLRLQQEIVRTINDETLFAWIAPDRPLGGMLAESPDDFVQAGDVFRIDLGPQQRPPYTFGNKGLEFQVFQPRPHVGSSKLLSHIVFGDPEASITLGCYKGRPDRVVSIELEQHGHSWKRRNCQAYRFKKKFRDPTGFSLRAVSEIPHVYYVTQ